MANRPNPICTLHKDTLLGDKQNAGFVDTFNWAVNALKNLKGGKGCNVDWSNDDHPVINVDEGNADPANGSGNLLSAVTDIVPDDPTAATELEVQYSDNTSKTIVLDTSSSSLSSEVTFTGNIPYGAATSTDPGDSFTFSSASDSNVKIFCSGSTIQLGVYYK